MRDQECGAAGGAAALRVFELRKRYGTIRALDGCSLELGSGEWIGLLGPNGAGKTTLMTAIAGLVRVDDGRFELLGSPFDPIKSGRARSVLSVVPQEIALYSQLTAQENLWAFGSLHGVERTDLRQRIEWALEWSGVASRSRQVVASLSSGMKRRLNIACAVLHEPRVLLLDEPTVGVDPQGRRRIWEMLAELRSRGTALIHSSHQLHEIESNCDRVLIMDHGRILAEGSLDQLIDSTLGQARCLRVTFSQGSPRLEPGPGFEVDGAVVRGAVRDVARDLPRLLQMGQRAGLEVVDIQLQAPSLDDVFTHVTGRELRD